MHLTLVYLETVVQSIRQSRRSQIYIAVSRNSLFRFGCFAAGENNRRSNIRRIICPCRSRCSRVDKRVGILGIASPHPIYISDGTCRIVKILCKWHVLDGTNFEAKRHSFRQFTAPGTNLIAADRTHIKKIQLTCLQDQILVRFICYLTMINDFFRRIHLNLIYHIRVNRILSYYHFIIICIETGHPSDIHLTGAFIGSHKVIRNGTLRSRLNLDTIQDYTTTEIVFSLKGNLISFSRFGQGNLHTLPIRTGRAVLRQSLP